ncbi:alpha/beta fold hydrolase [Comamonas sp. JC664]|uniref:alpha/beta fold hydrolase n=1 Tax=Comamonas sp. JC664 TaxID=2801917 RepID=UPI001747F710|nr:alpha/beta fold hydrolase [Comamonas sp. JC664]MBL0694876.1 alpha/beta fold hydrolase [Comamonas sp. JC664]GHG95024.1 alpha/beta hydrolase [Comamonas sp. KCTC 72670]
MRDLWFVEHGKGEPFLLLHPGGTDTRALQSLISVLGDGYRIIAPEQRGHGRTPDVEGDWSFARMAADTAALLEHLKLSDVHVFGWSDGAIVGLHLALARPDLVRSLVFGAAPFRVDGWRDGVLGGSPPDFMAQAYAELSPDGLGHWPAVVAKSAKLHEREPAITVEALRGLKHPVLVVMGDDDEVRFEHAIEMYEALPDGELAVVPRATHGLLVEKPDLLARLIRDFHSPDKDNGVAPLRRGQR